MDISKFINYPILYSETCGHEMGEMFSTQNLISNGNRTEWSTIQGVIWRVI